MKFISRLLSLILTLIIGFWLGSTGLLTGTTPGNWLETITSYLPSSSRDFNQLNLPFETPTFFSEPPLNESNPDTQTESPSENSAADSDQPAPDIYSEQSDAVDVELIEQTIIALVNDLREEQGVQTVASNDMLRSAATIRAIETEEKFSHTRPDGSDAFTVFEEEGIHYPYRIAGENLGMATHHLSDEDMAELLFNGWVDSQGHYENMIRPDYEEIGIGVHFDGEFLYATQLFGTQR